MNEETTLDPHNTRDDDRMYTWGRLADRYPGAFDYYRRIRLEEEAIAARKELQGRYISGDRRAWLSDRYSEIKCYDPSFVGPHKMPWD